MDPTLCLLAALVVFVVAVFAIRRFGRSLCPEPEGTSRARWRGGARLGNALHALQRIAEPRAPFAIVERMKSEAETEGGKDLDEQDRHLHRQAARIRDGDEIGRLTARLRGEPK